MPDGYEEQIALALQNILNECRQINHHLDELVKLQKSEQSHAAGPQREPQWMPPRHMEQDNQMAFDRYAKPGKRQHPGGYRGSRHAKPRRDNLSRQDRAEPGQSMPRQGSRTGMRPQGRGRKG